MGVYYSAPYVSDSERHEISPTSAEWTEGLTLCCDDAVIAVLRECLIPRYGPRALRLLLDAKSSNPERLRTFVARLLTAGVIPLRSPSGSRPTFGPRTDKKNALRPVAVAAFSWDRAKIAPALVELCPPGLDQVHPQVPQEIIRLLASSDIPG
jgi:hypothetical protein